jgi:putative membrane protein
MMHGRWRDTMGNWPLGIALLWLAIVLVVVGLVVAALVWAARSVGSSGSQRTTGSPSSPAREVLDQRYARGEISREEYLQSRRDLEDPG